MAKRRKTPARYYPIIGLLVLGIVLSNPAIIVLVGFIAAVVFLVRFLLDCLGLVGEDQAIHRGSSVGTFSGSNGLTLYEVCDIDTKIKAALKQRFIAFDFETTGLDRENDRIIEIGAVLFEDCEPTLVFTTLVKQTVQSSADALKTHHITEDMLAGAPSEKASIDGFLDFLGDAVDGKTYLVAHNAKFDAEFLINALCRYGYTSEFRCIDTLSEARQRVNGVPNYKQETLAEHFGIKSNNAHRAPDDAMVCGKILIRLLSIRRRPRRRSS